VLHHPYMNKTDEAMLIERGFPKGSEVEIDLGRYKLAGRVESGTGKYLFVVGRNGFIHRAPYDKVRSVLTA
jgi:hypothetical protein